MDVSVLGGWCSKAPPGALAYHWGQLEMPGGRLGLGLLQEQKHWAKEAPPRGDGTIILNSCLGDWAPKLPCGR